MFSENYIVTDKHSLFTKKHLSTLDVMPWIYTSLYDPQYLPVFSEEIYAKLNAFFWYRFPHPTDEPILDDRKILKIESVDGEIISYDCRTEIKYSVLSNNNILWRHFVDSTICSELNECRSKIDRITSETDILSTKISGIQYNADGSFLSISIYDTSYDLGEYESIETLSTLNNMCKTSSMMMGVATFFPSSDRIKYRANLVYPSRYNRVTRKVETPNDKFRQRHLENLLNSNLISSEQVDYVNSITSKDSMFDVEFVFSEDGQVEDILLYLYRIYEFKDLTTS